MKKYILAALLAFALIGPSVESASAQGYYGQPTFVDRLMGNGYRNSGYNNYSNYNNGYNNNGYNNYANMYRNNYGGGLFGNMNNWNNCHHHHHHHW